MRSLETALPGIQFDARGQGLLEADDHRVTIDLGAEDPVHAAVAAAEGNRGVRKLTAAIARHGWRIYVPRAGVFVEPDGLDRIARSPAALSESPRA